MSGRAIVFAYHNVGVRCLSVLLDQGIDIALVVTHADNPGENIWFESVAELAHVHRIPVLIADDPNTPGIIERISALQPDFLFSFYYRSMLSSALLNIPRKGAFNMHGSLLPKYRGRVPVNWAIIHGEQETGATLHQMVEKPDAGEIVDQQSVPILENDIAVDVFNKVTVAAEITLGRALPKLINGNAKLIQQDLLRGAYFGGRKPEDGIINWQDKARNIHNLIRAVAPPYPGARTSIADRQAQVLRTVHDKQRQGKNGHPHLYVEEDSLYACCADGGILRIITLEVEGESLSVQSFQQQFGLSVQLV